MLLPKTTPAALELLGISCRTPLPGFDGNDRTTSATWRRARNSESGKRGASHIFMAAAAGVVIHSGTSASVPSGCSTTSMVTPRNE
jgi:hypothetical protein